MMGGDLDASSKCIAAIHIVHNDAYLLIVVSILCMSACGSVCRVSLFFVLLVHFHYSNAVAREREIRQILLWFMASPE